jgi:hypothetical protein
MDQSNACLIGESTLSPVEGSRDPSILGHALLVSGERVRAIDKFDAAIEIYRSRGAGTQFIEYLMADEMRSQGTSTGLKLLLDSRGCAGRSRGSVVTSLSREMRPMTPGWREMLMPRSRLSV